MPCSPARVDLCVVLGHLRDVALGYVCRMRLTGAKIAAIEIEIAAGSGNMDG